jgi:hypothetical protein
MQRLIRDKLPTAVGNGSLFLVVEPLDQKEHTDEEIE